MQPYIREVKNTLMRIQKPIVQNNFVENQVDSVDNMNANDYIDNYLAQGMLNIYQNYLNSMQNLIYSRDDFLIEQKSNNSSDLSLASFSAINDSIMKQNQILAGLVLNYWTCEAIVSQNKSEPYPISKGWWNELSAELNKETMNWCCSTEELDASFLFPKLRKSKSTVTEGISHESSRESLNDFSTEKKNIKIFNVWRVPKVAFKMISRWDLARSHEKVDDNEGECEEDMPSDTFDKRKAAFGTKRDDLFYKTIGRDVRKYLQEQFQCGLGSKSLKEWLRNGTFLKEIKQFFKKEFNSDLNQDSSNDKLFCCVATLVSYQGYSPFLNENNSSFALKIHDSLHNFTKAKLINLWTLPEFKQVFKYYSARINSDNFNRFNYHRTMKSNVKGYKYAYCDILKQCD